MGGLLFMAVKEVGMSSTKKDEKEREQIKAEFRIYTKSQLAKALADWEIKTTGREKKEDLLDMIANFILANREEGENSPSEGRKDEGRPDDKKSGKKPSEPKTGAKSRQRKGGKVPEITKERRANVKNIQKTRNEALEGETSRARAFGEDGDYKPRQIKNAPESLTVDGRRRVERAELPEDIELLESMSSPSVILKGELLMTVEDDRPWVRKMNPNTGKMMTCYQVAAVIEYYSRFVYIPAEFFFEEYWDMEQGRMRDLIEDRQGAEVEFRVTDVSRENPDEPVYIGSRIAAMRKNRAEYWYSGREKGRALLEPGSIHEAKIVAVTNKSVYVEMFGAEVKIPERDITFSRVKTLRSKYLPGDLVDVKVKSVVLQDLKRAEVLNYPVGLELSIKEAKPDPRDKFFKQKLKNTRFRGIVRDIEVDKDNITWYWVEMGTRDRYEEGDDEGLPIRCRLGDDVSLIPQIDDIASGKITFPNDKQKRVFGTIYHIDPPRRRQRRR